MRGLAELMKYTEMPPNVRHPGLLPREVALQKESLDANAETQRSIGGVGTRELWSDRFWRDPQGLSGWGATEARA